MAPSAQQREPTRVDHVAGAVERRRVQADDVGAGQQVVELDPADAQHVGVGIGEVGVVDLHVHVERGEQLDDPTPDARRADDADHAPVVAGGRHRVVPHLPGSRLPIEALEPEHALAREQDGAERVLGDGHGVGVGRRA